jgi:hypothetical protein
MDQGTQDGDPRHGPKTVHGAQHLERNLAFLGARSARAVAQIRAATPRADITWTAAPDGASSASIGDPPRQLASLRAPLAEAEKFAQSVDIANAACVVVRGFGVGHHVGALARRLKQHGAVIVFEPDAALLRAVFERVDCASWLAASNVALITDAEDTGAIAAATSGIEAILAAGTVLVDHPPSKARLGPAADRFATNFTTVMKAVRTNVVTTLVQVDVTVKNLLNNLAWYATVPGVADLAGACKGKPAVVVSAGPSLRRNIDLLRRPGVREHVVIIAVQTVLKTLLAKGIKPHFVTALDYHEISSRFYEGLTAQDVEGVTLVAEPKCSRAILEAFPGQIRCVGDQVLDQVLGPGLARPMGEIAPGATVAHLAYYLARHLGCDPVVLIGQDLGFTDGQYYAPGAAIHQVWSGELSEFRTLEMLEWERIARMRSLLRKTKDQQGRAIYTDEQMSTYLVQFERDFMHDAAKGLTTIDATEGGVLKKHTKVMTLGEALENATNRAVSRATDLPPKASTPHPLANPAARSVQPPTAPEHTQRLKSVESRLRDLRQSAARISALGREAAGVLEAMLARQQDVHHVNRLITKVDGLGKQAVEESAYWLVQYINQTGQFNRFRADRAIHIDPSLSSLEKQKKEIERDIINVRWLADAADHVAELLDGAAASLPLGGRAGVGLAGGPTPSLTPTAQSNDTKPALNIRALVLVNPDTGALGNARDLARPFLLGLNPLQMTLARLAQCTTLAGAVLLSPDPAATRRLIGTPPRNFRIDIEPIDPTALHGRAKSVAAARLWSRHCWRGGIANTSCFDEAFDPALFAHAMERHAIDAAAIVGADWALIDPRLVDDAIARHLDRPDVNQLTFVQAPPGLGAAVISRHAVNELANAASPLATIGGLLGYIPLAPQGDPIAKPSCVITPPHVRDLLVRCVPDSERRRAALAGTLAAFGPAVLTADASQLAGAIGAAPDAPTFGLETVTIEAPGGLGAWPLNALAASGEDVALTITADPAAWHAAADFIPHASAAGFAGIHIRSSLVSIDHAKALLDAAPDVISVCLNGTDDSPTSVAALEWLVEAAPRCAGLPCPWIVPRITRRDAVYEHIEDFYNRWIMTTGAAVIDPLPAPNPGDRIEPLPMPANALARARSGSLIIRAGGLVCDGLGTILGNLAQENLHAILARNTHCARSQAPAPPMSMAS